MAISLKRAKELTAAGKPLHRAAREYLAGRLEREKKRQASAKSATGKREQIIADLELVLEGTPPVGLSQYSGRRRIKRIEGR